MQRALEIALVGATIGIAIVLIRWWTLPGSLAQWLWFVGVAVLVGVLHYVLRANLRAAMPNPAPRRAPRPARPSANDLFANELDRRWTGLSDPVDVPDARIRSRE